MRGTTSRTLPSVSFRQKKEGQTGDGGLRGPEQGNVRRQEQDTEAESLVEAGIALQILRYTVPFPVLQPAEVDEYCGENGQKEMIWTVSRLALYTGKREGG